MMIQLPRTIKVGLGTVFLVVSGLAWSQGDQPALVKVTEASMQDIAPVTLVPGTVVSRNDASL